ncbi:hypothetical protein FC18_GL000979 [Lacticaseibacillus sharpeae JCM 1186 = DSM 20505]|uniref:Uncharacterized protein n=2 Tax=Lacticaseibacillus sharpeae TaxID=1626 RepID=A0A0R1ZXX0_9LACO|nr:hypothetical protein FC18_GL000979 [Lacticaseibacillus sharpeae JCM 1186 = DSM 20505]
MEEVLHMRKRWMLGLVVLTTLLTACGHKTLTGDTAKKQSATRLQKKETIWVETSTVQGSLTSTHGIKKLQLTPLAKTDTPEVLTTHKGQYNDYTKISRQAVVASAKQVRAQNASTDKDLNNQEHYFTLAQLNAALKQAKAKIVLTSWHQLTYLKEVGGGMIARGNKLYSLQFSYMTSKFSQTGQAIPLCTVYSSKAVQTPAKHLSNQAHAGVWRAEPGKVQGTQTAAATDLYVTGGMIYKPVTAGIATSAERLQVEDLAKLSNKQFYSAVNVQAVQRKAVRFGYAMPHSTTRAATDKVLGTTYLFMSKTKLVAISDGSAALYKKIAPDKEKPQPHANAKAYKTVYAGKGGTKMQVISGQQLAVFMAVDQAVKGTKAAAVMDMDGKYMVSSYQSLTNLAQYNQQENPTSGVAVIKNGKVTYTAD